MTRYTDEYRMQHEADVKAAEEKQKERDRQHVILPKQHLARLETERESRRTADNVRLKQELTQAKRRLRWQWPIVHPRERFSDFDSLAWSQTS